MQYHENHRENQHQGNLFTAMQPAVLEGLTNNEKYQLLVGEKQDIHTRHHHRR